MRLPKYAVGETITVFTAQVGSRIKKNESQTSENMFFLPMFLFHLFSPSSLLQVSNTVHTADGTQYKDNLGLKVQSYSNMLSVRNTSNHLLCAWSKRCRPAEAKSTIAYETEKMDVQKKGKKKKRKQSVLVFVHWAKILNLLLLKLTEQIWRKFNRADWLFLNKLWEYQQQTLQV